MSVLIFGIAACFDAFLLLVQMQWFCGFQVVVVLQQVFALIQNLLSKWLNDSQVVEVSHQHVYLKLCF